MDEPLRFADILTTASSVASYLGEPEVRPWHVTSAIEILSGRRRLEELGRATSPMMRRNDPVTVQSALQGLVQRWYRNLGGDVNRDLSEGDIQLLREELDALDGGADPDGPTRSGDA